jgi:hypothetical protein
MAKKTDKGASGTSFHGVEIHATINELTAVLGKPTHDTPSGDDKVQKEWVCETSEGKVFTIYDWKEYRTLDPDETIAWHIGANDFNTSSDGANEVVEMLES